ncbi:hypothetical protein [Mycoplasmopsis fermentans]|uniref:hypothetical protein n=1 Tax=Mycoplasmopsis fermentans TaxID=2115 RepID=UPI000F0216CB|nr:hypothetical protein [Mycoplasmopsis fermentans]RMX34485.1 hypothetical protein MFI1_0911 [Mycoplasmopsis fermentans MF-I1]
MKDFFANPTNLIIFLGGFVSLIASITGITTTFIKTHNLKLQNNNLKQENKDIRFELLQTQKELADKNNSLSKLEVMFDNQRKEIERLSEELKALQSGNVDPLVKKLKEQIENLVNEKKQLTEQVYNVKAELNESKYHSGAYVNEIVELKRENSELKEQLKLERAKIVEDIAKYILTPKNNEANKASNEAIKENKIEAPKVETSEAPKNNENVSLYI